MDQAKQYLEQELERLTGRLEESKKMAGEPGMEQMAGEEVKRIEKEIENINFALSSYSLPSYEASGGEADDFKSVIIEVRPGVGGDEAKIWASDLLRMYTRYATLVGWKVETLDDGVIKIAGKGVFGNLRLETGVHRVQRIPATEAKGRIHTSTASVVVLPEIPENQIEIKDDDLIWEFTRGGGHGGQNVNKVATAVRLTHKPTGIVVGSRQERFQEQNRRIALSLLRSQLWEIEQEKKFSVLSAQRSKIGRSMRAEKIRTYNFPQNRVTDHRIGTSWHKLDKIIAGELGDVTAACADKLGNDDTRSDHQATG
jgi:peptide chain release factor 1